ncbi:hypothetical protein D3C75_842070 [compost metagenome]
MKGHADSQPAAIGHGVPGGGMLDFEERNGAIHQQNAHARVQGFAAEAGGGADNGRMEIIQASCRKRQPRLVHHHHDHCHQQKQRQGVHDVLQDLYRQHRRFAHGAEQAVAEGKKTGIACRRPLMGVSGEDGSPAVFLRG